MLKEELEEVKAHARIIAKEEIAAIPKPDDPTKGFETLAKRLISAAIQPLKFEIDRLKKEMRTLEKKSSNFIKGGKLK